MVHVTQIYPAMKPYLKGFHLSLECWRGNRDAEGWKLPAKKIKNNTQIMDMDSEEGDNKVGNPGMNRMEDIKEKLLSQTLIRGDNKTQHDGPPSGFTEAVPRFRIDLEALLHLSQGEKPIVRCIRNKHTMTAYYGFGNASSGGFGSTVELPEGLHGRFGIWGSSSKEQSSNFRELRNLVETVEEEAKVGILRMASCGFSPTTPQLRVVSSGEGHHQNYFMIWYCASGRQR